MKITLLTNILNPYRKAFYHELDRQLIGKGDSFRVSVMYADEYDRQWKYEDYAEDYTVLLKRRCFRIRNLPLYFNRDLKKRLSEYKPDILVASAGYMMPSCWKAIKFQKKLGYKLLFWSESHLEQQNSYNGLTVRFREWIRNRFYKQMDGFWYPGEKALKFVEKYCNVEAEKYCIPNLIENSKFVASDEFPGRKEVREKYGIDTEKVMWFAPMRLHWNKGLVPFMEMLSKTEGYENVQLVVAGEGETEKEISDCAAHLGIDLHLIGYKQEAQTIELYQSADAFFLPSLSDPFPLTSIEALWCGLPLLLSEYVGNAPETVVEGENGYVFSYRDESKGITTIQTFMDKDKDWLDKAGKRSLALAEERFDLHKVTERLLNEIKKNC